MSKLAIYYLHLQSLSRVLYLLYSTGNRMRLRSYMYSTCVHMIYKALLGPVPVRIGEIDDIRHIIGSSMQFAGKPRYTGLQADAQKHQHCSSTEKTCQTHERIVGNSLSYETEDCVEQH